MELAMDDTLVKQRIWRHRNIQTEAQSLNKGGTQKLTDISDIIQQYDVCN